MPMQVRFINAPRLQVRAVALPGNVISVFGRQGAVVAANGDYTASQITNVPAGSVTAVTVQAAIDQLATGAGVVGAALTKTDDTNVTATFGGTPTTALLRATSIALGWTGTLAAGRLNSNVVQAITNDTNVTGSITAQNLTLGWTSTLAVSRGGTGAGTWATNTIIIGGTTGTGTLQQVTSGAIGTVLTSQGPGVAPIYASAGAATNLNNGQCRFAFVSATQVKLSPYGGDSIRIAGVAYSIPSGGVTSANTSTFVNGVGSSSLAASTAYLACLFNNAGTLTIDFISTLTHVPDTTAGNVGVEIPTGTPSRTVIGMVRTNASSQFVDSITQRFVVSYFNRRARSLSNNFTATRTTTSATFVEMHTEIRIEFLVWSDAGVNIAAAGTMQNNTASANSTAGIGFDGTNAENQQAFVGAAAGGINVPIGFSFTKDGLSEGYHYATLLGAASSGTTQMFGGTPSATSPVPGTNVATTLNGAIQG